MHPDLSQPFTCNCCKLALLSGEAVCPRCGVPRTPDLWPAMLVFHLDRLSGMERILWETWEKKATETQIIKYLEEKGYKIEDQPVYKLIIDSQGNSSYVKCTHLQHDTPEKQLACRKKEAAKLAIRTTRHHLGFLKRLQMWSMETVAEPGYAMWTCIERHGPSCSLCKNREGMIIPMAMRFVTMLHPGCNCSLVPLSPDTSHIQIAPIISQLEKTSPGRAATMRRNLARCGLTAYLLSTVHRNQASKGTGCGCTLLLVVVGLLSLTLAFLLK